MSKFLTPNFPFKPRRFPFFYGWIILAVSTFGIIMSVPGQTIGVSAFIDDLLVALGLSRIQLSTAYMIGTISSAFLLPYCGRVFDRRGARWMVLVSTALSSVTLIFLSQCDRIAAFITFSDNLAIKTSVSFFVITTGFLFLRFSGQGLLCMTARSMLGKWFNRRRGFASGINGVLVTFSFSIAPLAFNSIINLYGWRETWIFLSAMTVFMAFVGWLFFRDNPEECGLKMDGDSAADHAEQIKKDRFKVKKEYTIKEARRTYPFWAFNLGLAAQSLIITAVTFHIVSLGAEMGLSRSQSLGIFLPMSIVSIFGNFMFGWLSDRIALKYCLAVMMIMLSLGVGGVPFFSHALGRAAVIFGFGASGGVFGPLVTVVWPRYYGRKHLGAISSMNLASMVFASAIGPFIFGMSKEWFGGYNAGIYACLVMPLMILLGSFKANNPQV